MTKTRDLADLGGGFIQAGSGAKQRTVESKLQDVVSLLDFIPESEHAAIKAGTSTYDATANINAALAASDFIFVPPGVYRTTGNHNIKNKSISGASQDESIIKLLGSNTNTSIFVNGGDISTPWGQGSGCVLQSIGLSGNWDGSTPNTETNISNIAALFKWWSGSYVRINDCNFSNSFGFGIFCYRLGYSYINGSHIYTNAKNGIHIAAPSGSDSVTSTSINYCSVHSCRGRSVDATTGGNAIYIANGFAVSVYGCVVEDVDDGFRLDGGDNRSVSLYYLHSEQCSNYDVYYEGAGLDFGMYQCILGSTNKFYQSNPQYTEYTAINNFGLDDTYELPLVTGGPTQVGIDATTPQTTMTSVTVGPGTWHLSAGWVGVHAGGTGQASDAQAYAIHTSAAIPGFSSSFESAVFKGELASPADQFNCLQGSLSLIRTVTSTTTFYLYGGPSSITNTLGCALTGHLKAVKVNGPY